MNDVHFSHGQKSCNSHIKQKFLFSKIISGISSVSNVKCEPFFIIFCKMSGKYVTDETRGRIVELHLAGMSNVDIASLCGVKKSTIGWILTKFKQSGNVAIAPKVGRPQITSPQVDRIAWRLSTNDLQQPATAIREEIFRRRLSTISSRTVKRCLNQFGLFGRDAAKKQLISIKNRKARLDFTHRHRNWTITQWCKVIWSDESKFQLFRSDGLWYVRLPETVAMTRSLRFRP